MTKNKLVIGSRESRLAVLQSEMVQDFLNKNHSELETEILTMKTTGDKILDRTLDKIGGKGLFVKELDLALLDKSQKSFLFLLFPKERTQGTFWYCQKASVNLIGISLWDVPAFEEPCSLPVFIQIWK